MEAQQEESIYRLYKDSPGKFKGTIVDILKRGNKNEILILKNKIIYSLWILFYNRYNDLKSNGFRDFYFNK